MFTNLPKFPYQKKKKKKKKLFYGKKELIKSNKSKKRKNRFFFFFFDDDGNDNGSLQNKEEVRNLKKKYPQRMLKNLKHWETSKKKQREDVDGWWEGCSSTRRKWGIGIIIFLLLNLFLFDHK
jgi:hypothetical protein